MHREKAGIWSPLVVRVQPSVKQPERAAKAKQIADPMADRRDSRGWIDRVDLQQLWETLRRGRWPQGPCCPEYGEDEPQYVHCTDTGDHDGLGRWRCEICAQAGDPGEGGTFTPLTGTLFAGMQADIGTFWLMLEAFADGKASVKTAREVQVNRHTTDRLFRLLRAAIYLGRSRDPLVLNPEDVGEMEEVFITAGLKGGAGGLKLEREPRKRGLKRRGRGTWDSDRLPVLGLLCRGGEVRLFVLQNVQTKTIRPIVKQRVAKGATVYTQATAFIIFSAGKAIAILPSTMAQANMPWTRTVMDSAKSIAIQSNAPGPGCVPWFAPSEVFPKSTCPCMWLNLSFSSIVDISTIGTVLWTSCRWLSRSMPVMQPIC
jgi:hypothetical protein